MKNILKSFGIILALVVVACSTKEDDSVYLNDRTSVAYFVPGSAGTLFVREDSASVFEVKVGVSEAKSFARNFEIEVLPTSTANPDSYTIQSGVFTIPANSVVGSFTVTGDFANASLSGEILRLKLLGVEDTMLGSRDVFNLTIIRLCPLNASFTGAYTLTQVTPGYAPAAGAPVFGNNVTVNVTMGSTELERQFEVKFYPSLGLGNPSNVPVVFELSCGNVNMIGNSSASGIGCGGSIEVGPTNGTPSTFDANDDSVFEITFHEDSSGGAGSCSAGQQTTIRLEKQ
ncbi:hypothetical protein EQG68_06410 [Flavobacterium piscinae]|uniref:DUF1735 domain-containing protein n=1 Tax=Flavobacterium piscinae TaxID=2506424 RepID=A0A4V1N4R8_9FLAO|nr:hypothetical protein [Flavobacterium piscinae]RXR33116.1 hypothetical protein EQG68_06410 [Flavobacterium piscinae]